ncbi:hypothetical protein ABK040_003225 [Willaertia magna]
MSEINTNSDNIIINEAINSTVKDSLYNSFVINRATETCPVLTDIFMVCFQNAPPEKRKERCNFHKERLDKCINEELKYEIELHSNNACKRNYQKLFHTLQNLHQQKPLDSSSTNFLQTLSIKDKKNISKYINCLRNEIFSSVKI